MGLENPIHLLFIGAVALVVLGPRRLPELARALGKGMREFREAISTGSLTDAAEPSAPAAAAAASNGEPTAPPRVAPNGELPSPASTGAGEQPAHSPPPGDPSRG